MADAPAERAERHEEGARAPEHRGSGSSRGRGHAGSAVAGNPPRPPQEPRRRRNNEGRFAGFGDGIERAFCARAERFLPRAFPVESHAGAATILQTIVARRPGALLLCTFSHCGEHVWPDGEVVTESQN